MTISPKKPSAQPESSSNNNASPRAVAVQMDEVEGLRVKLSSEDSASLAEPINTEDSHYVLLRGELDSDSQNLEADSWSVAVDQNYAKALNKEAVKRQDVIYELIQTEMHHVRTLKILLHVYMHELKQSGLIDEANLERLFFGVEGLYALHQHFFHLLKVRQSQSQEEESPNNYLIAQLGDILIYQFSGTVGENMMKYYSAFCGHQSEAVSFYKDQLQSNKKLQILTRKIGQLPLVRRLGIPECFLLVTQRITKYPILVERIIQNTEVDTDEHKSLVQGLALIKDTISQVNDQVSEYEKVVRLKEIGLRLEPKSQGKLKDGQVFPREDLILGKTTLLHEGTVTWKSSGRQKDIIAVLLSDVILLLQEKDQKLVFAAMDNKLPVVSLQRLIVREVAHEDKAMFLICACTTSLPLMYEIHTSSREERSAWMTLIREAVNRYPDVELYRQLTATLQQYQDALKIRDDLIRQSLTEKQQLFAALYENVTEKETPHKGLLLRGDETDLQQGETLLKGAIDEVENLQTLLFSRLPDPSLSVEEGDKQEEAQSSGATDSNPDASVVRNGDAEDSGGEDDQTNVDPELQEAPEELEQSADDDTHVPNCDLTSSHFPGAEVCDRVISLAQRLYSLQAIVAQQDSLIELQNTFQSKIKQPALHPSSVLLEQEKQRNLEKQKEELHNLHRMKAQHREEQQRWERDRDRQTVQIEALEAQLKQREDECRGWEEKLNEEKAELDRLKDNYQQDLERLRETTRSVDRDKERLAQEKERIEKIKKIIPNYEDPSNWSLSSLPSFRGSIVNGGGIAPPKIQLVAPTSGPAETPPRVPPRRESICHAPTTNTVHKPPPVQQQIPTKLATLAKGKEKSSKTKTSSHQRAASIDMSQVVPIRVTGKEGGSLRAKRNASPRRTHQPEIFNPPGSVRNVKSSQSFSTHVRSRSDTPPPPPPPFPKEILLHTPQKGKEKVIFL